MVRKSVHGHPKFSELQAILQKVARMEPTLLDGDVFQTTVHSIYYLFTGKESYAKFNEIPAMLATLPVDTVEQFLAVSFPRMCSDLASSTPSVEFLSSGVSGTISFTPRDAYLFLAQCFLCVPLLDESDSPVLGTTCHLFFTNRSRICQKLSCFLNYFNILVAVQTARLTSPMCEAIMGRSIIVDRLVASKLHGAEWWASRTELLGAVSVQPLGVPIESLEGLQADFANKHIGGGVLRRGCVQEEIRMMISPELILPVLLCDTMEDNEAVVVRNTVQFSAYSGYGSSFKCCGFSKNLWVLLNSSENCCVQQDSVVCIDAIPFGLEREIQFHMPLIVRELEKCRIATFGSIKFVSGNWGCGVFGGDPELKAIIQWLSCSVNACELIFCPFDSKTGLEEIVEKARKISVGAFFNILIQASDDCSNRGTFRVLSEIVDSYNTNPHTSE